MCFFLLFASVADSARGGLRGLSSRIEREAQVLDSSDPWKNPLDSGAAPPWFREVPPAALASIAQAKKKSAEGKKKKEINEFQSSLSVEVAAQVGFGGGLAPMWTVGSGIGEESWSLVVGCLCRLSRIVYIRLHWL